MNYLGIEIGGTKIQVRAEDDRGQLLALERFNAYPTAVQIRQQLTDVIQQIRQQIQLDAVGIGFGGPVDYRTGQICQSFHVDGWHDFSLTDWLQEITQCPVYADNDANVAALGEAMRGAGRSHQQVYYVTVGSGVGSGYVRMGEVIHGRTPGEWEIGHLRLDLTGTTLQDVASGWGVDERIRQALPKNPDSVLSQAVQQDPGHEARHLGAALDQGDAFAEQILAGTVQPLAWAFSHVMHLVHPDVLILGGGVSNLGERFRQAIEEQITHYVMPAFHPLPPILLSELGEQVVPIGAIEWAKYNVRKECGSVSTGSLSDKL
ncbi:ROK family protein [Spirosoma pomorum]